MTQLDDWAEHFISILHLHLSCMEIYFQFACLLLFNMAAVSLEGFHFSNKMEQTTGASYDNFDHF